MLAKVAGFRSGGMQRIVFLTGLLALLAGWAVLFSTLLIFTFVSDPWFDVSFSRMPGPGSIEYALHTFIRDFGGGFLPASLVVVASIALFAIGLRRNRFSPGFPWQISTLIFAYLATFILVFLYSTMTVNAIMPNLPGEGFYLTMSATFVRRIAIVSAILITLTLAFLGIQAKLCRRRERDMTSM